MQNKIYFFIILLMTFLALGCNNQIGNPAADGFNASNSDTKAIAIADEVMNAMEEEKHGITHGILVGIFLVRVNYYGIRKLEMSELKFQKMR